MDWSAFSFEYCYKDVRGGLMGLLIQIEAYKGAALNLILPPDWHAGLDRLNRVRAVRGTTALEGNPLSEAEVSRQIDAIDDEKADAPKVTKEQQQIRNSGRAQAWVKGRFVNDAPPLSVQDTLKMHKLITIFSDTNDNVPGELRAHDVTVGTPDMGGVHHGAPHQDLERLMQDYVEFVGSQKLIDEHPVIRALLSHFFLVTIHPFGDGNGRVSRLVESGVLYQQGYNIHGFYGLSNYFYKNENEYKTLLQKCRQSQPFDVTPFIQFGLKGFSEELEGINNFIKTKINRVIYLTMMLRAYNKYVGPKRRLLNKREYDLLSFLLMETEPKDPFSDKPSGQVRLSELTHAAYIQSAYSNVTRRTFHREITRLSSFGFINFYRVGDEWVIEIDFEANGKY